MSCPDNNCGDSCTDNLQPLGNDPKVKCNGIMGLIANVFCALWRIGDILVENLIPKKNITGLLHFNVTEYDPIPHNTTLDLELITSPFSHEVLGVGVSYIPPAFEISGAYNMSDKCRVQLMNLTSGVPIGDALDLTTSLKVKNFHDNGNNIVDLPIGNVLGVRLSFFAEPGDLLNPFPLDVVVYVRPKELNV